MRSKQYFTSIKNNPHEISTDPFFQEIQPPIANYLFQKNKISYKLQLKIKESLKSMIKKSEDYISNRYKILRLL